MKRLSWLTLIFSIAFLVLLISPALLSDQFGPYTLLKTGDLTDLLTPLILIPLYWYMYRLHKDEPFGTGEMAAFLVLAGLWVQGQGMHLSANSIGHLVSDGGGDLNDLTHFYDEVLSHYLWHSGVIGLSALLMWRQWKHPFSGERSSLRLEIVGAIIYGFMYFIDIVEGGTTPIGVPFALLVVVFGLVWGRKKLREQPLLTLFFVGAIVSTILFAAWAIRWSGDPGLFPQFSEVGIID